MLVSALTHKTKTIALTIAAIATIVGAPLAASQPAYAAVDCTSGDLCLWQHSQWSGWKLEYFPPRYSCVTLPSGYWDQVTSYWNRTGHLVTAFPREYCGGLGWDIANGESGGWSWPWNDEMRSFYTY